MSNLARVAALAAFIVTMSVFSQPIESRGQTVTAYYTPAPAVGYVPVRRGLLGLRRGWLPVVAPSVPVPVTSYYAPAPVSAFYSPAPVSTFFAPQPAVTTYYPPPAPVIVSPPVTTYYPPTVRTYYPPVIIER